MGYNYETPWSRAESDALRHVSRNEMKWRILDLVDEAIGSEQCDTEELDSRLEKACSSFEKEFPSGLSPFDNRDVIKRLLMEDEDKRGAWSTYSEWYHEQALRRQGEFDLSKHKVVNIMAGTPDAASVITGTRNLPSVSDTWTAVYLPQTESYSVLPCASAMDAEAWLLTHGYKFIKQSPDGVQLWASLVLD